MVESYNLVSMGFLLNLFKGLTMRTAVSATAPAAGTAPKVDADSTGGSFQRVDAHSAHGV